MLLNPDTELLDDGLDRLAAEALELGGTGRAAGAQRRRHRFSPRRAGPRSALAVGAGPGPGGAPAGARSGRGPSPTGSSAPLEVSWLTGACIAGPTALLRRLGPFDPALHMFGEDVDLGLRAGAAGVRSRFDPAACRIVHHGQGSSTLVYGSREGWRATGTLNWRAAVRRAYGPAAGVARLAGAAAQPAPAADREDPARTGDGPRSGGGRGRALGAAGAGAVGARSVPARD